MIRGRLRKIVRTVIDEGAPWILYDGDKRVAVVIPYEEWQAEYEERARLFADNERLKRIVGH